MRILVVEDSPVEQRLIAEILKRNNIVDVLYATDGESALALALEHKPDIVLLDVVLPKKTGFQVCRAIKTADETSQTKVILLTSKRQQSDKEWGIQQGADAYVTKPIDEATLLKVIGDHIS